VPIELGLQPVLERQVKHARAVVEAESAWRERLLQWDFCACTHLPPVERRRMQGFRANILESLEAGPLTPPMFMIPGLTGPNYFNADEFVGAAAVAAETAAIRAEFLNLIEAHGEFASHMRGLHEGDQSSASTGRWSMVPLIRDGQPVEKFAAACPRTMAAAALLEQPQLGAISPSLYFSVLEPGSSIAPHRGITNGRVIGHWPLIVPQDCAFRVGGETRPWQVGEPLIFDDMITHEAWNRSDQIRVVLIADLWRPELGPAERSTVTDLLDVDLAVG
jgi:aspartyl/asparaginyl beta-hydroxylase (cupin superfamily)